VLWHSSGNEFFFSKDGKVSVLTLAEADRVRTWPLGCSGNFCFDGQLA
jgi:hypothetical protein